MIELNLPWPPTVNTYWRSLVIKGQVRVLTSLKGRDYQSSVARLCLLNRAAKNLSGRLSVTITAYPPDRRARDLDNIAKSLLDALTKAGVWGDDSQIDRLIIQRGPVIKDGRVSVEIVEGAPAPEQLEIAA